MSLPPISQFCFIKVVFKGVYMSQTCFPDESNQNDSYPVQLFVVSCQCDKVSFTITRLYRCTILHPDAIFESRNCLQKQNNLYKSNVTGIREFESLTQMGHNQTYNVYSE